ncbi:uncharacterized protein LOC132303201 [Cornus florida]|uniref:uncharacterized protein LOC132303201 n=1 Tax=Cornus florida TaxID=4283 RepID=UPI002898ED49|nr:uncharacterized protein LOC132303201 [Cornus florida]XP_059656350.1 uncharacterized protein LOC132303201 [Cornus florida]XP_059656351.1 uncharacterized protein LOC132303201 [Cornus florida]
MIENIRELQKSYSDSPIGNSNDLFSIVRGGENWSCGMLGFGPTPSDVWGPLLVELINNVKKSQEEARVELQEMISKMQADYDNKLENLRANYDDKLENLQQQVVMLVQMQQQNCSGQGFDSLNAPPRVSPNSFLLLRVIQIKWARIVEVEAEAEAEDGVVAVLSEFPSPWMGPF